MEQNHTNQREKLSWEPLTEVLVPPCVVFLFMYMLHILSEHQFSHLQIGVYTYLSFPPTLPKNVNCKESRTLFYFGFTNHIQLIVCTI